MPQDRVVLHRQFTISDQDNPAYRCCCQCCHVTTGGIGIAMTMLFVAILYAVRGLVFLIRGEEVFYTVF